MYMVFVDMVKERISVEPAKVYGMGDCFGGWDTASYPFEVDGKTMKRTTDSAGELRLYAASDIDPVGNDWWRMEFVLIDGRSEEHTSELQSRGHIVCRLLLEQKKET